MQNRSMRSARGLPAWALWLGPLLLASAALKVLIAVGSDPISTPDTGEYLKIARQLGSMDFSQYTGSRTPGYPLFLLMNGLNPSMVRVSQNVVGLMTVCALFYAGRALTRSYLLATLAGAWYGLSAVQIKYENTLLTECLTTFGLAIFAALLVGIREDRRRLLNTRLVLLGLAASMVALVRPAYLFFPVLILVPLVLAVKLQTRSIVAFLIPAFLPILAWSLVNLVVVGSFSPATMTGYSLMNRSGPLVRYADNRYADIRDAYLAAERTYGPMPTNLIWRPGVIDGMMARTGQTFAGLSQTLTRMSVELFLGHPATYLRGFAGNWLGMWNPESFWRWEGMHDMGAMVALVIVSRAERALSLVVNGAFVVIVALAILWSVRKRRLVLDADVLTIACVVLAAAVAHSAIEVVDPRYGVPLQPLTVLVVLTVASKMMRLFRSGPPSVVCESGVGARRS